MFCRGTAREGRPGVRRVAGRVSSIRILVSEERVLPAPNPLGDGLKKRGRPLWQCGEIPLDRSQYSRATPATTLVAEQGWRALEAFALKHKLAGFTSSPVSRAGHLSSTILREPQRWPAQRVRPTRLAPWLADCARPPLHSIYTTATTESEQLGSQSFARAATSARVEETGLADRCSPLRW
jgi:hypothetical protein